MQQLWNVLGPEGSKYVVWLSVGIALLIGLLVLFWTGMRVFGRGLNMGASGRGQPQRLGITGAFNLDRKGRKLVIVRRDNVEHLLLIGGPNDVLVESSIIRAQRASARDAMGDAGLVPLPAPTETQVELPLPAPPVAPVPPRPVAPPPAPAAAAIVPPPAPPVRPAAAIPPAQPQPAPVSVRQEAARPVPPPPVVPPRLVAPAEPLPPAPEPQARPAAVPPPAPKPQQATPATVAAPEVQPAPPAAEVAKPQPAQPPVLPAEPQQERAAPAADTRLSDMARRLQSVLKGPLTPVAARTPDPAAAAKAETIPIPLPSRNAESRPEPEPAKGMPQPQQPLPAEKVPQGKPVSATTAPPNTAAIDSLEEEMARLLGRPGPEKH